MTVNSNDLRAPHGGDSTTTSRTRPMTVRFLGWLWIVSGALQIILGVLALQYVTSEIVITPWYADLLPILFSGIAILLGMGIVYVLIGYGISRRRRWAWKTGTVMSLISIGFGIVIVYSVIVITPLLSHILSIFSLLVTASLNHFVPLRFLPNVAKLGFMIVGIVLFTLMMRKSVREHLTSFYETGGSRISTRIVVAVVIGVAISMAAFGYGYSSGIIGVPSVERSDAPISEDPFALTSEWTIAADMPTPRDELRASAIGSKIYTVGGYEISSIQNTNVVEVYDTKTNTWSEVKELPFGLDHVGAATYQGKLYLAGGFRGGYIPSDTLFIYDPVANEWSRGANMPTARGALEAEFIDGILYAVGGLGQSALAVNEAYDPATDTWTAKAPMPTARDHLASAVVDGKLYVIGGREGNTLSNHNVNEEYDPMKDKWTTKAPMPTPRGGLTAASLSDSIYVFCGETPSMLFTENEQYVPSLDIWIEREELPKARRGCASAEVGGSIYIIGGTENVGLVKYSPSNKNEVFTPLD